MPNKSTALTLPDEQSFKRDFLAINKFQAIVHANMKQGHDYGIIPGTTKPTLLKPGAEKIAKLLGLADTYDILDKSEDWDKPFFRYLIKCTLTSVNTGTLISEGLGECNSMESKYRYRWVFYSSLPGHLMGDENKAERLKLVMRSINTKKGKMTQYRLDNEDIFSQVNTILKMSKKRALVDAALSAGRLSDIFTQDMEDISGAEVDAPADSENGKAEDADDGADKPTEEETPQCPIHKVPFKMNQWNTWTHPTDQKNDKGKTVWCSKDKVDKGSKDTSKEADATPAAPQQAAESSVPAPEQRQASFAFGTLEEFKKSVQYLARELKMNAEEANQFLVDNFDVGTLKEVPDNKRNSVIDMLVARRR